jgi:hypothetical protein
MDDRLDNSLSISADAKRFRKLARIQSGCLEEYISLQVCSFFSHALYRDKHHTRFIIWLSNVKLGVDVKEEFAGSPDIPLALKLRYFAFQVLIADWHVPV